MFRHTELRLRAHGRGRFRPFLDLRREIRRRADLDPTPGGFYRKRCFRVIPTAPAAKVRRRRLQVLVAATLPTLSLSIGFLGHNLALGSPPRRGENGDSIMRQSRTQEDEVKVGGGFLVR